MNKIFTIVLTLLIFSCDKKVSIKVNIEDSTRNTDDITLALADFFPKQKNTKTLGESIKKLESVKKLKSKLDTIIKHQDNKIIYMKYKADSLKTELSNHKIAYNDFIIETINIPPPEEIVEQKPNRPAIPEPVDDNTDDDEIEEFEDTDFNKFEDDFEEGRKTSKFIAFDEAPETISGIKAKYPAMAKSAGIEGTVVVEFFINKKGVVTEVEITSGTGTALDKAAVDAVKKSTWKPARHRTKKVGVWISQPLRFYLNK